MRTRDTLNFNADGVLTVGGVTAPALAKRFGTPLYVLDEAHVRSMCRAFTAPLKKLYPDHMVCYASKALSATAVYRIVASEGLGADVVTGGELYTALRAGVDPKTVIFHGNNKSADEIAYAVRAGVYALAVDAEDEVELIADAVKKQGLPPQGVTVRVNPGIEAHTHHYIQTATPSSKFGFALDGGAALSAVKKIRATEGLRLLGLNAHIGSQIFDDKPYALLVEKLLAFVKTNDVALEVLDIGGGFGIRSTDEDAPKDPGLFVSTFVKALKEGLRVHNLPAPRLIIEPGRSIVAEAGLTLYTVGAVKEIAGIKKYVAVDGGMFDNPRYVLYQAKYSATHSILKKPGHDEIVTIAGKCCESGDVLIEGISLPKCERGDLLAVFSTGAYNYSMSSHYNRNLVPPMVLVKDGKADYIVKPESYEDLVRHDAVPEWLA
ncbi:MAG: diaminopimelate decarboxylase [Clostridiales bacterium]|jgi:diaminopimelate decarboxylase|nr:diaminopimelate decarboxylase [Clostridiales bacterium]